MMFKGKSKSGTMGGSYAVALVFAIIAAMGFFLMYTSPPHPHEASAPVQTVENREGDLPPQGIPLGGFVWRAILFTGVIVALLWIGANWYKRRFKRFPASPKMEMEVVGRRYVGPKHYLLMVKVEGRRLLLGVAENSVNLLCEFAPEGKRETTLRGGSGDSDIFSRMVKRLASGLDGTDDKDVGA